MEDHINLDQARKLIDSLDLTAVINRLMLVEKWPKKHAIEACQQYRNYLFLVKKYGKEYELPPSRDIDEVWHAHILHTEDYFGFCQQIFGKFLHHRPSHEMTNSSAIKRLEDLFEQHTQRFYYEEFGDYIYEIRPTLLKTKIEKLVHFLKALDLNKSQRKNLLKN